MSQNLLLLVLCCVSGLGNSSLFPQLLLKTPPIAQPVSPYAADYEKPAEVYHQPMTGYVVPVVPAVRTLPQLDLSSHWNTISQKWLAWKSSLKSLLEAKMQALKPQFRQQQVMLLAPVAVAPRVSYSKPAKKPNCCCNCAPVYTTPKPYTPKPCCCCPTPYTTIKPYTTPKPYQSPICCFKMMIPQTTPYYSTPQAYQTTLKPYYGPTAAYSTIKSYYPSPKPAQPSYSPVKYNAYPPKKMDCKEPVAYASNNVATFGDERKNHKLPLMINQTVDGQHISNKVTFANEKNETDLMRS